MARQRFVEGVERVQLPEIRQAIPHVHTYLRKLIMDGTLAPGTKLSQVALAEQIGVSRTPLREVLRMLQEEGLVEIEPNQRTRVATLDPQELDQIYANRIMLETLAVSMSLGDWCAAAQKEGKRLLRIMKQSAQRGDLETWFATHASFHELITVRAGESFRRQLQTLADQTIRYIRIYQSSEPDSWQTAGQEEHEAILDALIAGDEHRALIGMAHHLARTALRVLEHCAPDYEPMAVPHAVNLIDRQAAKSQLLPVAK
ncbi:GntR family transcriptional regulator [Streptomyces mirabilis]|uniref:GntR family transcriptional regulator n=1 Tax=Streptomyces mirabilis TaxID=68239 RepID=UPI0033336DE3